MLQAFLNIFKIPELRKKLFFTLGMLVIYRVGFWIPLMGVDQAALAAYFRQATESGSAMGQLMTFISIFTGGNLGQSTLFGLGIMPYISAAIIFQLLATVLPSLEQLQKEGPAGRQKIQEYTRYATVGLCLVQGAFVMRMMLTSDGGSLVYPQYTQGGGMFMFMLCGIVGLTAGTCFLMWLGEQIDKYGIGNGASLIITAGIISSIPGAIMWVVERFELQATGEDTGSIGPMKVLLLIGAFVFVVAGTVLITQGQRRIPVQQAKHTRGRKVYGGQRTYLPLRVNHGGVMPIIFASSLMMIPTMGVGYLASPGAMWSELGIITFLSRTFQPGQYLYEIFYIAMIYFFAYFWTTVQFQPKEMSIQLRDSGSFIPGLRPGPRTAEYLETVMERITYVGAGFLAAIAVLPSLIQGQFEIPFQVAAFLGGTGLLITVSVALDFVQRIEANLMMRNYQGFLSGGGTGKGPRIRGPQG